MRDKCVIIGADGEYRPVFARNSPIMAEFVEAFLDFWSATVAPLSGYEISARHAIAALFLLVLLVLFVRRRRAAAKEHREFAKNVQTVARHIEGMEDGLKMLIKNEILPAVDVQMQRLQADVKSSLDAFSGGSGTDAGDIVAPLSRQADAHLKQSAEHRDEIGARLAQICEERMNRIESRMEGLAELVKEQRREDGAPKDDGALHDKIEQQAIYLHDEFAALAAKIDGLAEASGGASSADGRTLETLAQAVQRLGDELDAKFSRLNENLEKNMEARWSDALGSLSSLRERIEELAGAGERDARGDISSLSRLMRARGDADDEDGRRQLAELLPQILPLEHFALDAELPGGERADALVRFPDPRDSVAIDAGFSPPPAESSGDGDDAQNDSHEAFAAALAARINHIADNLISTEHTGGNALMFVASEAVFAEIHARHRDAVNLAQARGVWLVSPTTLPAVVNVANTAIRDHQARRRLQEMRAAAEQIAEEARHFENRIAEIGDYVNSAQRSVQRAESAGGRLAGSIRDMSRATEETEAAPPRFPAG